METAAKIAIGAVALGGVLWLASGTSVAAPMPPRPDGKTQGQKDGCAAGAADGKSGLPQALNPTDAPGVAAAANASSDPAAYLSAYQAAYDSCWTSSKPSGGVPTKPAPGKTPPPGATGPDRAKALDAWGLGCNDGTDAGYAAGYAGDPAPSPSSGAALASGNTAAYRAAFLQAVPGAYAAGKGAMGLPGYEPGSSHADAILAGGKGACSGYFDGWYLSWVSGGAKTSGARQAVRSAAVALPTSCGACGGSTPEVGVFGLMRRRAAPRATRRSVSVGQTMERRRLPPGRKSLEFGAGPAATSDLVYSKGQGA